MPSKVLILTAGTNPPAIASVLTRVKEVFDYDKVIILASSASKSDAEAAVEILRKDGFDLKDVEYNTEIVDGIISNSIKGASTEPESKINDWIREVCKEIGSGEMYVDITGGTKQVSALMMSVARDVKNPKGEEGSVTGSPCDGVKIWIGYLLHLTIAKSEFNWWSSSGSSGYYPKVPRLHEAIWGRDVSSWERFVTKITPIPMPKSVKLPYFAVGGGAKGLLESIGEMTWLINSLTTDELKVNGLFQDSSTRGFLEVRHWGDLDIEIMLRENNLKDLFRTNNGFREDSYNAFLSLNGLIPIRIDSVHARSNSLNDLISTLKVKNLKLSSFLTLLRLGGYSNKVYLDTSVLMYGFHNELFEHNMLFSLLGRSLGSKRLQLIAPKCTFLELMKHYEEGRKDLNKVPVLALRYLQAVFALNAVKGANVLEGDEVEGVPSYCDTVLHLKGSEEVMIITADSGLYENMRYDDSIKADIVKVKVDAKEDMRRSVEEWLIKEVRDSLRAESSEYVRTVFEMVKASRVHAAVSQAILTLVMLGISKERKESSYEVVLQRDNSKVRLHPSTEERNKTLIRLAKVIKLQ